MTLKNQVPHTLVGFNYALVSRCLRGHFYPQEKKGGAPHTPGFSQNASGSESLRSRVRMNRKGSPTVKKEDKSQQVNGGEAEQRPGDLQAVPVPSATGLYQRTHATSSRNLQGCHSSPGHRSEDRSLKYVCWEGDYWEVTGPEHTDNIQGSWLGHMGIRAS